MFRIPHVADTSTKTKNKNAKNKHAGKQIKIKILNSNKYSTPFDTTRIYTNKQPKPIIIDYS